MSFPTIINQYTTPAQSRSTPLSLYNRSVYADATDNTYYVTGSAVAVLPVPELGGGPSADNVICQLEDGSQVTVSAAATTPVAISPKLILSGSAYILYYI